MIDLVSTRFETDPEVAACARMVAAIISQAIEDACMRLPLSPKKRREAQYIADGGIRFLFGDDPQFSKYADLIGISAETVRQAITQERNDRMETLSDADVKLIKRAARECKAADAAKKVAEQFNIPEPLVQEIWKSGGPIFRNSDRALIRARAQRMGYLPQQAQAA